MRRIDSAGGIIMKKRLFYLCFLILAVSPIFTQPAIRSPFVAKCMAAIPTPAENEFPTVESVVKYFFEAFKEYDVDSMMKCFPIKNEFSQVTMEDYIEYIKAFDSSHSPIDEWELHNLRYTMDRFDSTISLMIVLLIMDESDSVFEKIRIMDPKAPDYQEKLRQLRDTISLQRLHGLNNLRISEEGYSPDLNLPWKKTGFLEMKYIKVTIDTLSETVTKKDFIFTCGKIGTNWRIAGIFPY
jgi:hypothetical protein